MESLQRIYAISFPDTKLMKEWKHFQEEAAKRDHRKIGRVGLTGMRRITPFVDSEENQNCVV